MQWPQLNRPTIRRNANRKKHWAEQAGEGNRVKKILKDDQEHVDWLESQLHMITKMGYECYLTRQMREEH
jgi:bacterioferritin (cytochrome b1)